MYDTIIFVKNMLTHETRVGIYYYNTGNIIVSLFAELWLQLNTVSYQNITRQILKL